MMVSVRDQADLARLDELIRAEADAKQRDRYRAVRLALDGDETLDIAEAIGRGRTFVQTWVYRYRDQGVGGLVPVKQTGKPRRLSPGGRVEFRARVIAGPVEADQGVCALRGEDMRRILRKEFGVAYSLSAVYDLLRDLRLSPLTPRPGHRKHDPVAAAAWVEQAPLLSTPDAGPTPEKTYKSGSKMKRGSGNKGR
jgi:transposase